MFQAEEIIRQLVYTIQISEKERILSEDLAT